MELLDISDYAMKDIRSSSHENVLESHPKLPVIVLVITPKPFDFAMTWDDQ